MTDDDFTLTAREHLEKAWEKAHVVDVIVGADT